jgi:hypothetical protein
MSLARRPFPGERQRTQPSGSKDAQEGLKLATPREVAIKILTEPPGVLAPAITGVGEWLQAIELEISETGCGIQRLVIVHAHFPPQAAAACEEIARNLRPHFKDVDLYFTILDRDGEAEVYVPAGQSQLDIFVVAAAVAVMKASWGWDETNPLQITVAGEPVKVNLSYMKPVRIKADCYQPLGMRQRAQSR